MHQEYEVYIFHHYFDHAMDLSKLKVQIQIFEKIHRKKASTCRRYYNFLLRIQRHTLRSLDSSSPPQETPNHLAGTIYLVSLG